jgi:hypothetical protein
MCRFLQALLISLGPPPPPKKNHTYKAMHNYISFFKMSIHHTSHSVFQELFVLTHNIPRIISEEHLMKVPYFGMYTSISFPIPVITIYL